MLRRRIAALVVTGLTVASVAIIVQLGEASTPATTSTAPPAPTTWQLQELVGAFHEHSGYSDGWPGSTPKTYHESAKAFGLDFMGPSEHAENLDSPAVFSEDCLSPGLLDCTNADPEQRENAFRKWDAMEDYAREATDERFTAFRGFEWSSDRFGHLSVYFSRNKTGAYADGGFAALETFWSWFTRAPSLGGGADGLGTFNHPGRKKLSESDPGFNWNDFAYEPAADERMVGFEVFNKDRDDGGAGGPYPEGSYARVLDKGWHVGAIGAEDLGHRRGEDWGGPSWPKTVILAGGRTTDDLRAALLARRFYAIREAGIRLTYTVDGRPMGSRLAATTGRGLRFEASANQPGLELELVTSEGRIVETGVGSLRDRRPASANERWYFVRVRRGAETVAYSSPVWVSARPRRGPDGGEWYAGDLHVHTCYSHDAYCGPSDTNTGPDEAYTFGTTVGGRFLEASARGLDWLAITDHDDLRSFADADFGSHGVTGIPGFESSISGHAQVLGVEKLYAKGDGSPAAANAYADAIRDDGGVFQANHPAYRIERPFEGCADTDVLHWRYGYAVEPDTLEVWNPTSSMGFAERYWECWLERGSRIGATGGSDSHWATLTAAQGVGNPTTWVFATEPTRAGILAGLRAGRTTISRVPPGQGGLMLTLEADENRNGSWGATIGDEVRPGTPMRVVADGLPRAGRVRVRANGETLFERALPLGGEIRFEAPRERGWVRATLLLSPLDLGAAPTCEPSGASASTCAEDLQTAAMTSPIYLTSSNDDDGDD